VGARDGWPAVLGCGEAAEREDCEDGGDRRRRDGRKASASEGYGAHDDHREEGRAPAVSGENDEHAGAGEAERDGGERYGDLRACSRHLGN